MLNMIKMDLYRMVRTKSMYVVWIVMAAAIFFSTSMSKLDIDTMNKEAEQQQTESIAETVKPETINMGMSVFLPTQPGEKVTVHGHNFHKGLSFHTPESYPELTQRDISGLPDSSLAGKRLTFS